MHLVKTYERVEVYFHSFLTSALGRMSGQLRAPVAQRKEPQLLPKLENMWAQRAGRDTLEKI
jgi:hypothetical protein